MKCKNPNCGKEVPDNMQYCNEKCLREHMGLKKQANKIDQELDVQLSTKLTNTQWQKGLSWRQEKISAIAEARQKGIEEKTVFTYLKRAGLTDQTARKLMDDARYWE